MRYACNPREPSYDDNPREHDLEMRGRDIFEDGRMIARIEGEGRAYWEGVYTHTDWRIHGVDSHGNARGAGVDTGAEYFKDIRQNLPAVVAKLRRRRNPVEGDRMDESRWGTGFAGQGASQGARFARRGGGFAGYDDNPMPIEEREIRVGDGVQTNGLTGDVLKVARVNVTVQTSFRASPTGPWYRGTHIVPKAQIFRVVRDGKMYERAYDDNGFLIGAFHPIDKVPMATYDNNPAAKPALSSHKQVRYPEGLMTQAEWVERHAVSVESYTVPWDRLADRQTLNRLGGSDYDDYVERVKEKASKPLYRAWSRNETFFDIPRATYEWAISRGIPETRR